MFGKYVSNPHDISNSVTRLPDSAVAIAALLKTMREDLSGFFLSAG